MEPRTGLAHARNAAIAATACDYFIWTDDDVTVDGNWIRDYEAAFERHPEAAFFGGPILPRFEGNPPRWIVTGLREVYSAFAGRDEFDDETRFDRASRQLPFGANMATRAQEQYLFRYDPTLGRQPGSRILSGEESDCLLRICRAGGVGTWISSARVDHWIDSKRQSVAYLRRYYAGSSYVLARARIIGDPTRRRSSNLDVRWRWVRAYARYLWSRMTGDSATWIRELKQSAELSGKLAARRELRVLRHGARRPSR